MIERNALLARLIQTLEHDYVALLAQRGNDLSGLIGDLQRRHNTQADLQFLSLCLPVEIEDGDEFYDLVLTDLVGATRHLSDGAKLAAELGDLLYEHRKRSAEFRLRTALGMLGTQATSRRLVIVLHALPEVSANLLRALLALLRTYHAQRDSQNAPGQRLRFLVIGEEALWCLCYNKRPNVSPFNIAKRIFVGGLSQEELASLFPDRNREWLKRLHDVTDGIPALLQIVYEAAAALDEVERFFGVLQDPWNALPKEARRLLKLNLTKDELRDCIPDFACPEVAELDPPWAEAFWLGFLRVSARKLLWRSALHRLFVQQQSAPRRPRQKRAARPAARQPTVKKVLISYSREDSRLFSELEAHLKTPERQGLFSCFCTDRVPPGDDVQAALTTAIAEAHVAILLLSSRFLACESTVQDELRPILKRAAENELVVIPVFLSSCRPENSESLSRFRPLNSPEQPLDTMTKPRRAKLFRSLVEELIEQTPILARS